MSGETTIDAADWSQVRRILCIRLDAMGDVLMAEPAIRALKTTSPDRSVTLLTSSSGAAIARLMPSIDHILVYEAPWMKATAMRDTSRADLDMAAQLRKLNFDAAVILTSYSQSPLPAAMLCYLADIPCRLAHCRENPYQLLTHWIAETEPHQHVRHEVRRQLDLVSTLGARTEDERLSLSVPGEARQRADEILVELVGDRPWILIHPGATAASRRYTPEGFAQVADCLHEGEGCEILFTGNAAESDLINEIQSRMCTPSHSLAGRLDLATFAAVIARAPVLLSNNTGAVHVAAAMGTPVVDLYALTNPQHTPWGVPHRVLFYDVPCRNCYKSVCPEGHHRCLRMVTPESVVRAVRDLLLDTLTTVGDRYLVHPGN